MSDMTHMDTPETADAIREFPRLRARTLRFGCGAPRSAKAVGDGGRVLFLRSDGPEDLVTALWMNVIDADGTHREVLLADPRKLLADADSEDVPAEEKARRERAREGGSGIVSYSVDAAGRRVAFTINGALFLTDIDEDGNGARTREVASGRLTAAPVLNPRISPDGRHILYTTGRELVLVDLDDDDHVNVIDTARAEAARHTAADAPHTDDSTWKIGLAEFAAGEEMDRYDGFWWGPDSRHVLVESFDSSREPIWHISDPAHPYDEPASTRYPRALTENADVHLTLMELVFNDGEGDGGEGGRYRESIGSPVSWDRATYEYLAAVSWSKGHDPLILVQDRLQRNDQVLQVVTDGHAPDDGAAGGAIPTRVLEEHHNDQWLDLIAGTPALTPDGRLVCAMNDMDADTNRLTVDGRPFTPVGWQVRTVLDVADDNVLAVVQRTPETASPLPGESFGEGHDARSFDVVTIGYDGVITPVTTEPGQWTAARAGNGMVVSGRGMRDALSIMRHSAAPKNGGATVVCRIANHAAIPGFTPNIAFARLGEHRLYTAIIAPSAGSPYAEAATLPVLMKPYGGPGFQQVVAAQSFYWEAQWWADQGFLVVTADGRGTTGRGPRWDREIFEDMKQVTLADQVEAVQALPEAIAALNVGSAGERDAAGIGGDAATAHIPAPDLDKVCMIGWSYGGFLSALAVLDAPDVFHAACAGAPPTDWTLYDTHYTERYLGLDPEVYRRNGIVEDAPNLRRPLMLIHGFADDNVTIAHSLLLSQALMAAGRQHTFLPLTGITHMTNDETVAENLLILQRDFLYDALGLK